VGTKTEKAIIFRARGWTYQEIGDKLNISRQRVHQLLTGYKSKHTLKTREGERKYGRSVRDKVKRICLSHYGHNDVGACVKCGFDDLRALSIDHIQGRRSRRTQPLREANYAYNYAGHLLYHWLIKNNFPEGYQTLCMNCQWIKRAENGESHREYD
jgi:transcriptional regulator with XRE-family HTH domain